MARFLLTITDETLASILRVNLDDIDAYLSQSSSSSNDVQWQAMLQHPLVASHAARQERLLSMMILTYKIRFLEMVQSLWSTYRQSGLAALPIDPDIDGVDRHVWPQEVRRLVQELHPLLVGLPPVTHVLSGSSLIVTPRNLHTSLTFVDSVLHALDTKHKQLHQMLTKAGRHLYDYREQLQEQVHVFVDRILRPVKMEIDCQIELIHYDYKHVLCERELLQQLPTVAQIDLLRQLCKLKYKQDVIQSDIDLYRHLQSHPIATDYFQPTPLSHCTRHPNLRRELEETLKIFQDKRQHHQLDAHIESLEMRREQYQDQFTPLMTQFWDIHRPIQLPPYLTHIIHTALNQRLTTLSNSITCIHKYKLRLLQLPHP